MARRYLADQVLADLERKMVFVAGPRQVGKTTLARDLLTDPAGYLSWDIRSDRERILREQWPDAPMLVLDEVHKFRRWRNMLKGLFDQYRGRQRILVTGSARLDYYRFGGDSLQGRYHLLRLHPLSVAELGLRSPGEFKTLLALGGFPEPFYGGSDTQARRWSRDYRSRLLEENLIGLESVHDLGTLEQMMLRLPDLVGSPLSINALREDLQVNHRTAARWAGILELRYFRDVQGREVDFVIVEDRKPARFIECKWEDEEVHPALRYARVRFPQADHWQITAAGSKDFLTTDGIRVCPALTLLARLV